MNQSLEGQVAIVTGTARGIGRAFCQALAAEGVSIVACDRNEVVHEVKGLTYVADVGNPTDVRRVVDGTVAAHGRVDILVNNAGVGPVTGPLDDWGQGIADFEEIMGTNTRGSFLFGRAVTPVMIEGGGGNIINVSTDHVFPPPGRVVHGHGRMDIYNASKWAINGLTLDWSVSLREHNIRVNQLCMGATLTQMTLDYKGDQPDDVTQQWMQPSQIADVLVQLLQEGPVGRTGQSIGMWVGRPMSIDDSTTVGLRLDDWHH